MITIDELQALNGKVTYNPLGVVKIRVNYDEFWHFYSDKTPVTLKENIHTHPYSYESKILFGGIRHHIYDVEPTDEETLHKYQKRGRVRTAPLITIHENVNVIQSAVFDTYKNNSYYIHNCVLHQTELLTSKCVTYLKAEPWVHQVFFIKKEGIDFSVEDVRQKASVAECWEIIEYTLNDDDNN